MSAVICLGELLINSVRTLTSISTASSAEKAVDAISVQPGFGILQYLLVNNPCISIGIDRNEDIESGFRIANKGRLYRLHPIVPADTHAARQVIAR